MQSASSRPWHVRAAAEILGDLGIDPTRGLSDGEAAACLVRHGTNELVDRNVRTVWHIL